MIDFDYVLERVGGVGRYQIIFALAFYYYGIPGGLSGLGSVFLEYTPEYRCMMYPFDNSSLYPGLQEEVILNLTTPLDEDGEPLNACVKYGYSTSSCTDENFNCVNQSEPTVKCDDGYHYDDSLFTKTVVTEFNLVCDRRVLQSTASASFMLGYLFGALIFGLVSDKYGRRVSTILSTVGMLLSMLGTSFCGSAVAYIICRFLVALFVMGTTVSVFVHIMEILGSEWRTRVGIAFQTSFPIGYMFWSFVAYMWRDWHKMQFVSFVISTPTLLIAILSPESPRWLFSAGQEENGKQACRKIAKWNRKELAEDIWKLSQTEKDSLRTKSTYTLIDLFRSPALRMLTIKVGFIWMANSMVYYGVALNAGSLAGNIFVNNALAGVLETASYIFCALTMDHIGRRLLCAIALTGAGISLFISTIANEFADGNESLLTFGVVMAFIGRTLISGSFVIIYNYTSELYPTVVRSNGLGYGLMTARIGSMISPFLINLQHYISWLPNSIFGAFALIGGLVGITIRDTTGYDMLETIEEAEAFHQNDGNRACGKLDNKSNRAKLTKL